MHRKVTEDAAAREERAVEHEGIGKNRGEMHEGECSLTHARHVQHMQQHRRQQPGHEGGVLDRVPAPEAAPAQHFVGPIAADEDACAEESPGDEQPVARRFQPVEALFAFQQRAERIDEGHGQQRIADEDNRRMYGHPGVLQQRVKALTIRHGLRGRRERTLGQHEHHERRLKREVECHAAIGQTLARAEDETCNHVDEQPKQERPLLARPEHGDFIHRRQFRRGVPRHIGDIKAVLENQYHQISTGRNAKSCRKPGQTLPPDCLFPMCNNVAEHRTEREEQRESEQEIPIHQTFPFSFSYFEGHLMSNLSARNTPS